MVSCCCHMMFSCYHLCFTTLPYFSRIMLLSLSCMQWQMSIPPQGAIWSIVSVGWSLFTVSFRDIYINKSYFGWGKNLVIKWTRGSWSWCWYLLYKLRSWSTSCIHLVLITWLRGTRMYEIKWQESKETSRWIAALSTKGKKYMKIWVSFISWLIFLVLKISLMEARAPHLWIEPVPTFQPCEPIEFALVVCAAQFRFSFSFFDSSPATFGNWDNGFLMTWTFGLYHCFFKFEQPC